MQRAAANKKERYNDFLHKYSEEFLLEQIQAQCPEAWGLLSDPTGLTQRQLATFTSMPEATSVKGPGWYMSVIMDSQNWHWWKLYTGQSKAVCRRVRSHYAEKSDGHGIFHRLWSALPTRMAWFFSLGSCDQASSGFHPNDLGLWLNIVEKLFALGLQTLPTSTLSTMAPPYWKRLSEVGINTSDPLDQGHRFAAKQFVDPELRKLYWYRGMCISRGMRKAACVQKHLGKL